MNSKIFLTGLFAIILSSCVAPKILPAPDQIDVHPYGSYITVFHKGDTPNSKGELIAIDSSTIVLLSETSNKTIAIPLADVERFKLRYAKPKQYGWTIPTVIILPFIHGYYSIFTVPLHLIVTISVTASGRRAFTYSNKNMTYDKLKMFARFPQGIPPNIDMSSLE